MDSSEDVKMNNGAKRGRNEVEEENGMVYLYMQRVMCNNLCADISRVCSCMQRTLLH